MKHTVSLFILLLSINLLPAQTAVQPVGSGTESVPYQIATLNNLYWLSQADTTWTTGHYFIQTENIDAGNTKNWDSGNGFSPIGIFSGGTKFYGSYDGQNHTIDSLYINRTSKNGVGLFGAVDSGAEIKNLGLTNLQVTGQDAVGGLVGYSEGDTVGISNCYTTGSVSGINNTQGFGGLVGYTSSPGTINISSCYSSCSVSGNIYEAGGLVGTIYGKGSISNSHFSGTVTLSNIAGSNIGGLVGSVESSQNFTIEDSYSSGSVSTVVLSGNPAYAGGLAGTFQPSNGSISKCYSTGLVDGGSGDYVGGLVGNNSSTINNCYSTGQVSGSETVIGGLAGQNSGTVINSFSTGQVSGSGTKVGGLVGNNNGTVSTSFWDKETSGQTSSDGGTGKTTVQMKTLSTYTGAGWDFEAETTNGTNDYWNFDPTASYNSGYPYLFYQHGPATIYGNTGVAGATLAWTDTTSKSTTADGSGNYAVTVSYNWTGTITPSTSIKPLSYYSFVPANKSYTNLTASLSGEDYTIDIPVPTGSGTKTDPYMIATLDDLYWLSQTDSVWTAGHYFKQTANIDAGDTKNWDSGAGFSPIGTFNTSNNFHGIYNGQNHTIDSLYINRPSKYGIGLFGDINAGAIVENIGLLNLDVTGDVAVGGLVGGSEGSSDTCSINNCYTTGTVTGETSNAGGLLGASSSGVIIISSSHSECSVTAGTSGNAGGLVGDIYNGSGIITNSYATGTVNSSGFAAGGLIGYISTNIVLKNSYATGAVNSSSDVSGGLAGFLSSVEVSNCYATGSVSGNDYVGGFAGYLESKDTLSNCYSTGLVAGSSNVGGLIGKIFGSGENAISNSFWDTETSNQTSSDGGTGKTTAQMKSESTFTSAGWDFSTIWAMNGSLNSGYPYLLWQHPYSWTGTVSSDWSTTGNWYNATVPDNAQDVYINRSAANFPIIAGTNALANNVTIDSTASLTISADGSLTTSGDLTNNGTLTLSSDATGNGSLIVEGTATGDVTAERYIEGYTSGNNGWHEVSVPFGADPSGTSFDPTNNNTDDLYYWDEANYSWMNYRQAPFTFTRGEGFLMAQQNTTTNSITGPLENTDVPFSNLSLTTGAGNGWHMLGNPFTSAVTWGDANWLLSNIGGVAKVWNEQAGNYTDVSSGGVIPSTNAFFVQAVDAVNSLTIPAADRLHDATNNYKNTQVQQGSFVLKITGDANGYYDENTIGFKEEATEGYDLAFDAHKLFSMVNEAPQLWTMSQGDDFSTSYLPVPEDGRDIPLNFKPGTNGNYHLSWNGIENLDNVIRIKLEDTKEATTVDMRMVSQYDFTANAEDNTDRFVLHINNTTGIPQVAQSKPVQVYSAGSDVYIRSAGDSALEGEVILLNIIGQEVIHARLNGTQNQVIHTHLKTGVYIVRLNVGDGDRFTQKVFIR